MSYEVEKDWITEAGFRAVVIMTDLGHRCGYVGVSNDHPLFGITYNGICDAVKPIEPDETIGDRGIIPIFCASGIEDGDRRLDVVFDVHGGLTYSAGGGKYPVPSDLWWFGYDCGHAGDASSDEYFARMKVKYPGTPVFWRAHDGDVHRTLEYCIEQCESLASQFISRVNLHGTLP